ncbi:MAG: DctP family TRAP transporter solute-binding subunit [Clostridia bacterium]|nr:DctP family TRAP transporter solute-binding subunit [Clostridia bacterium]
MKMNKLRAGALLLSLVLGLSGCGAPGAQDERDADAYQTIELVMAVNGTDTQIDTRVANYFAQLVEEGSGGNVTVAVFPNDQLAGGNATKGIEMIAQGSADLAAYATCTLAVIDSQLPVATIPWSFESYEEARRVIDESGYKYYAQRLAAKGITYLGSFHNGFRQITNSKHAIKTPADVKNLKIRVPGSEIYMGFFRTLGADPTSMSWSEVFTAIQQGTIDGQENGVSVTSTAKMVEVQKHLTMWNYSYENDLFIANTLVWENLEPKTQELLRVCAVDACNWGRDVLEAEEEALIEGFKDVGMTVTYLTEEEKAAFADAIAAWKAGIIQQFGADACGAFGIA